MLVLSHALGLSLAMWDPQVVPLSREFRVVRYDDRGHGGSPVPDGPYRIEDLGRIHAHLVPSRRHPGLHARHGREIALGINGAARDLEG